MADSKVLVMPAKTYTAQLFTVQWETKEFSVAGTLDGAVDLATPAGTFQLSQMEAAELAGALVGALKDLYANCLYDKDPLLAKE